MVCNEKTNYIAPTTQQESDMAQNSPSENERSTPNQLLDKYPYAKQIGWTVEDIRFLYDENLVDGELADELLILNKSFEKVLELHRKNQQSQ